jgi:hypothetical protein
VRLFTLIGGLAGMDALFTSLTALVGSPVGNKPIVGIRHGIASELTVPSSAFRAFDTRRACPRRNLISQDQLGDI